MNGQRHPMCDSAKLALKRLRQRLQRSAIISNSDMIASTSSEANTLKILIPDYLIYNEALQYSFENLIRLVFFFFLNM